MFTKPKLVILLIVIGISIGLVTSEALAGPPWPALVKQTHNVCFTTWLADDLQTITEIRMDAQEVYQPLTGNKNITCHGKVDFGSPDYATIADICTAYPDWAPFCNGKGNMTWRLGCMDEFGNFTDSSEGVITKSGVVLVTCQFKLPTP